MATIISVCTLQNLKARSKRPYKVLLSIQSLILVSYIAESSMLVAVNVIMGRNYYTKDHNVSRPSRHSNKLRY